VNLAKIGEQRLTAGFLAFAGLVVVMGCGSNDERPLPATDSFEQWDSAGVQIAQTSEDALHTPLPWVLDTVPDLEIGTVAGEEPYQFSNISSVVGMPDGEIVVVDQGSLDVRWFDDRGTFLRSVGGEGRGPGEFVRAQVVPQFRPDSLVVFDLMQRRLTSISLDGEWVRTQSGGESQRTLLRGRADGADAGLVLIRSGGGGCPSDQDGVCEESVSIHVVDPGAGTSDTVAVATRRLFRTTEFGNVPLLLTIPFDPVVSAAAGSEGFLVTTGEEFEIWGFGRDGALDRIIRIDCPPLVLGEDVLETAIQEYPRGAQEVDDIRRMFGQMDIRDTKPTFQALRVDPLEWIWAERFRINEELSAEWIVFDPSGRARGVMTLPSGLAVHDIGEHFVLGVTVDEMGVEYVRRYPLARDGS